MNNSLNRYLGRIYQVVGVVIGLGWIWCSAMPASESKDECQGLNQTRASSRIIETIQTLLYLMDIQLSRIKTVVECQIESGRETEELKSLNQNNLAQSLFDTPIEIVRPLEGKHRNLSYTLINEVILQECVIALIQKLEGYLEESFHGRVPVDTEMDIISMIADQANRMTIKRGSSNLQTRLRMLGFDPFENGDVKEMVSAKAYLVKLGELYRPNALKEQIKNSITKELEKMRYIAGTDLPEVLAEHMDALDIYFEGLLNNDMDVELYQARPVVQSCSDSASNVCDQDVMSWRIECFKDMALELFMVLAKVKPWCENEPGLATSEFNLNRSVGDVEAILLWQDNGTLYLEFRWDSSKSLTDKSEQHKDKIAWIVEWPTSELNVLLLALRLHSKININVKRIDVYELQDSDPLLVLLELLALFEDPIHSFQTDIYLCMKFDEDSSCTDSVMTSDDLAKCQQVQERIKQLDKSRGSVELYLNKLTSRMQKSIWPLVTHFLVAKIDIVHPRLNKIDFLDNVNWKDGYTLRILLTGEKDTVIRLGGKTTKDKALPVCSSLSIITELSHAAGNPPILIDYLKTYVINLDGYLQPLSVDMPAEILTKKVTFSIDILLSYVSLTYGRAVHIPSLCIVGNQLDITADQVTVYKVSHALLTQHRASYQQLSCNSNALEKSNLPIVFYTAPARFNFRIYTEERIIYFMLVI
ncbi:hypothetical protein NEHOM01_1086 [Nematocida homosporus]|uniref:uncharacterized protein n=1 Tax=Nematocida homosporus TaxID=1912981 RepID=UPI0022206A63|nr:uncharacterized protein NEHOM01_1086 [Nematocida homosporus]KAI5185809.1 hypothetical protein NEHOM01_1086 [Nematocida homosporus]